MDRTLGHEKLDKIFKEHGRGAKSRIAEKCEVRLSRISALLPGGKKPGRTLSGKLMRATGIPVEDWDAPAQGGK